MLERKEIATKVFAKNIGCCESQKEFENLIKENIGQFEDWKQHILPLMANNNLNANKISEKCGVSVSTAKRYIKEIPPKRKYVIEFAILFKFNVDETNELLTRWAKYEKLNAKNIEDAIWIFMINQGDCENPQIEFTELKNNFETIIANIDEYYNCAVAKRKKAATVDTLIMEKQILSAKTLTDFQTVMREVTEGFKSRNQKLIDYINGLVRNYGESANKLFHEDEKFKEYHYRQLEALTKNESPNRMHLIILGLKLNCTTDGINYLLDLAGMSPLCSKDKLESAIFFYLEELYCNCPDSLNEFYNKDADNFSYDLKNIQDQSNPNCTELKDFFADEDCYNYIVNRLGDIDIPLNLGGFIYK